jgi:hypothetical protein
VLEVKGKFFRTEGKSTQTNWKKTDRY